MSAKNSDREMVSPLEVGEFINDFGFTIPLINSGWDDISDKTSTAIKKIFHRQSNTSVVFQCSFHVLRQTDGIFFAIGDEDKNAVHVFTFSGGIHCQNGDRSQTIKLLSSFNDDQWYGFKIVVNLHNQSADIYLDGELKASNMKIDHNQLDRISLGYPYGSGVKLKHANTKVSAGYAINEDFEAIGIGNLPADWSFITAEETSASVQTAPGTPPAKYAAMLPGNSFADARVSRRSLCLSDASINSSVSAQKTFTAPNKRLATELKFMLPAEVGRVDGMRMELQEIEKGKTKQAIVVETKAKDICYFDRTAYQSLWPNYKTNVWYTVRIICDSGKADLYINGELRAAGINFINRVGGINSIKFSTPEQSKGTLWLDDIKIYPEITYKSVPVPQSISTRDYLIGAQVCNIWKEIACPWWQNGWDAINKPSFQYRKPVIGWYDEGNPRVTDWEIKVAVEHGINVFLSCWYADTSNGPILNPLLSGSAIHDGLFYARYKDYIKFAIMYENSAFSFNGIEDLLQNLLPFWIEYYFKKPYYLKLRDPKDGKLKPLLTIYDATSFRDSLGENKTNTDVAEVFSRMRTACEEEGLGGLLIWAQNYKDDDEEIKKIAEMGFEGIYSYLNSGVKEAQIRMLDKWREKSTRALPIIPVVGMGWDSEAVMRIKPGENKVKLNPYDYEEVIEYAKANIMPRLRGEFGEHILLLDNWSEYGEGHYIFPTDDPIITYKDGVTGYGYVDVIRNSFIDARTKQPIHEDYSSAEIDTSDMQTMYARKKPLTSFTHNDRPFLEDEWATYLYFFGNWEEKDKEAPGSWERVEDIFSYADTVTRSRTQGDYLRFRYDGANAKFYGIKGPDQGMAEIYIDDQCIKTIDCYAKDYLPASLLFETTGYLDRDSDKGVHKVEIVVLGKSNPSSSDSLISIDRAVVEFE